MTFSQNHSCQTQTNESIYIALGSNLGQSLTNLQKAAACLQSQVEKRIFLSRPWRTSPQDCPDDSPPFINAVAQIHSPIALSPRALLDCLQSIERELGRVSRQFQNAKNAPRPIDLDIIAYGRLCLTNEDLILPHPRAHRRFFVLAPLLEVAPDFRFPNLDPSLEECLQNCETDPFAKAIEDFDWSL